MLSPKEIRYSTNLSAGLSRAKHGVKELIFHFRTSSGKGSGTFSVPLRLMPKVIKEFRECNPGIQSPVERYTELIPGPRGGTGPGSNAKHFPVYHPDEQVVTFLGMRLTTSGDAYAFYPWWGRGVRPQYVPPDRWDEFVDAIEDAYNQAVDGVKSFDGN
jgi:hypothetical protein